MIDRARLEDRRDYDVAEHALRAMLAEHGAGHVILALKSVARRHRRDHDPELDAAAAELLERLEREVDGDDLDDEAPGPMRLDGIEAGDIVLVARVGRRFYALVTGSAPGGLRLAPLDRRVNHHTCQAVDVVGHWSRRGRPQASDAPLRPSPHQLELDTTQRQ